jgi:hypothetical protein
MFSYTSSNIDWCEDNFTHHPYIVEFWNTISNIPFVLLYFLGMYNFNRVKCNGNDKILYRMYLFVGLSSMYFHATLSHFGQLLDEYSIMCLMSYTHLIINKNNLCCKIISYYTIIHFPIMIYMPNINIPILFAYSGFSYYALQKIINKNCIYWLIIKCLFFISINCWILDKYFCNYTKQFNLHAFWHLFISLTGYFVIFIGLFYEYNNNKFIINKKYLLPIITSKQNLYDLKNL